MLLNESQLIDAARELAQRVSAPKVIYLHGDLGAGKTTFCRAFVQACGHEGAVKSPTYTLVEPYELSDKTIIHCDLYRLSSGEELELLGFREFLNDNSIVLIEWPEKAADYLPAADINIHLSYHPDGREVEIHEKN